MGYPPRLGDDRFRARPRFLIDTQRQIRLFDPPYTLIGYEYEESRHARDLARSFHNGAAQRSAARSFRAVHIDGAARNL